MYRIINSYSDSIELGEGEKGQSKFRTHKADTVDVGSGKYSEDIRCKVLLQTNLQIDDIEEIKVNFLHRPNQSLQI